MFLVLLSQHLSVVTRVVVTHEMLLLCRDGAPHRVKGDTPPLRGSCQVSLGTPERKPIETAVCAVQVSPRTLRDT